MRQTISDAQLVGTAWTMPGHGMKLSDLKEFMGVPAMPGDERILTNLKLTGLPRAEHDWEHFGSVTLTVTRRGLGL